jgi:hypothetical protein
MARLFDVARLIGYSYDCCPGYQPYGNNDSAQVISHSHFHLLLVVMENVLGMHGCPIDARHPARNADTLLFGNRSDLAAYLPARMAATTAVRSPAASCWLAVLRRSRAAVNVPVTLPS